MERGNTFIKQKDHQRINREGQIDRHIEEKIGREPRGETQIEYSECLICLKIIEFEKRNGR